MFRNFSLSVIFVGLSLGHVAARADGWGMMTAAMYEASRQRSNLQVDEKQVHELNLFLQTHFNRHPVIAPEDLENLLSPTTKIETLFDDNGHKQDINGNQGNTFKVKYRGKELVLESMPKWIFHSDNEQHEYEWETAEAEMKGSYKLEDIFQGSHVRQVHHIVAKIKTHWRTKEKEITFYAIKEYVPGESVLYFDYGVTHRGPGEGKRVDMAAATQFMIEFFSFVETLLNRGIFPFGTNDDNVIMQYDNRINRSKIEWKIVNHFRMFTHKEELNVDDIRTALMNWGSMLTWRLCEYTGYSNHKLAKAHKKHPIWEQLNAYLEQKQEVFSNKMKGVTRKNLPKASLQDLKPIVTDILTLLQTKNGVATEL